MIKYEASAELENLDQEAAKPQAEIEKIIEYNRNKTSADEGGDNKE